MGPWMNGTHTTPATTGPREAQPREHRLTYDTDGIVLLDRVSAGTRSAEGPHDQHKRLQRNEHNAPDSTVM
eukprot:716941-Pleurochrysis_carterae.AAC.2